MKSEPIEIELTDNGAFTHVTFLVDRKGFIDDIQAVRKRFKVNVPFSDNPFDLENHLHALAGLTPEQVEKVSRESTEAILNFDFDRESDYDHYEKTLKAEKPVKDKVQKIENGFRDAIAGVRRKYQYPEIFDEVIKQAILFHKITSFKTAYATFFNRHASKTNFSPSDTIMAIAVTPFSTEKDIKEAFEDCKNNIREFVEMLSPVYKNMEKDTITNIKRDRVWYWEHTSGKKYRDILEEWNNTCPNFVKAIPHKNAQKCQYCDLIDLNVIEKAVSRYKKNLNPQKS